MTLSDDVIFVAAVFTIVLVCFILGSLLASAVCHCLMLFKKANIETVFLEHGSINGLLQCTEAIQTTREREQTVTVPTGLTSFMDFKGRGPILRAWSSTQGWKTVHLFLLPRGIRLYNPKVTQTAEEK